MGASQLQMNAGLRRFSSSVPAILTGRLPGLSCRVTKVGTVKTSVHRPQTTIATRISMPFSLVTPNSPTSGEMKQK